MVMMLQVQVVVADHGEADHCVPVRGMWPGEAANYHWGGISPYICH